MSENPAPRISVIVPHYNDLERLDACLAALEVQSLPRDSFEVIVADNRSPVGMDEVVRVVGARGRVVDAPVAGAGMARNSGVEHARAPVLAFTDCDCVPGPHWLEHGVAALESADFVGGRMRVLVDNPAHMSGAEAFEAVFAFDNRGFRFAARVWQYGKRNGRWPGLFGGVSGAGERGGVDGEFGGGINGR